MNIREYLTDSHDIASIARANEIDCAKVLLKIIATKRDKLRALHESRPPEQVNAQVAVAETAQLSILNWLLEIPDSAKEFIKSIKE